MNQNKKKTEGRAGPPNSEPWDPTDPVAKKVKSILEDMKPVVSVRPERTVDDLGLAPDSVRLQMNGNFFPTAPNKLSAGQVTGNTSVLTLVVEIEDLGGS
jgi:hypothetical protein